MGMGCGVGCDKLVYASLCGLSSTPTVPRPLFADEEVRQDLFILPQEDCLVEQESM